MPIVLGRGELAAPANFAFAGWAATRAMRLHWRS